MKTESIESKTDIIRLAILLSIILGATLLPLFAGEVLLPKLEAWKEQYASEKGNTRRLGLFTGNPFMEEEDGEDADIRALSTRKRAGDGEKDRGASGDKRADENGVIEDLGILWSQEYGPGGVKLNADGSIAPDAELAEALKSGDRFRIDRATVAQYKRINPETVGMIRIPGTVLNHPLMMSPNEEGFYLNHDFLKRQNANGTPFLAAASNLTVPAGNAVAYGHNIRLGRKDIFQPIAEYEKLSFYKAHPYVEVVLPDRTVTYLVFAYFIVDTADADTFVYWQDTYFAEEGRFTEYMAEVKKRNWLDTGIDCARTDTYLTLSSCSVELARSGTNRMVLLCRAMRAGETPDMYAGGTTMNPAPMLPGKLR